MPNVEHRMSVSRASYEKCALRFGRSVGNLPNAVSYTQITFHVMTEKKLTLKEEIATNNMSNFIWFLFVLF